MDITDKLKRGKLILVRSFQTKPMSIQILYYKTVFHPLLQIQMNDTCKTSLSSKNLPFLELIVLHVSSIFAIEDETRFCSRGSELSLCCDQCSGDLSTLLNIIKCQQNIINHNTVEIMRKVCMLFTYVVTAESSKNG